MLNRASSLLVESLEEAAASYGKHVATHPVKVTLAIIFKSYIFLAPFLVPPFNLILLIFCCKTNVFVTQVALGCILITGLASLGLLRWIQLFSYLQMYSCSCFPKKTNPLNWAQTFSTHLGLLHLST